MSARRHQKGTVLLMVLVLVAVMALVTVPLLGDTLFGVKRTANLRLSGQADWFAYGAEQVAREGIIANWQLTPNLSGPDAPWLAVARRFPVAGGLLEVRLNDGGNCFNLNSLVSLAEDGATVANAQARAEYAQLLAQLGVPAGLTAGLVDTATDWIDSDTQRQPLGAEGETYGLRTPGYRAANRLFAEAEELRAVEGYEEVVYRALRPFLCALPQVDPARLNVNLLTPAQAPLLAAIYPDIGVDRFIDLLRNRPPAGWDDPARFLGLAEIDAAAGGDRIDVQTYYYRLDTRITLDDLVSRHQALLHLTLAGDVNVVWRRFGGTS